MPVTSGAGASAGQLLLNLASFGREAVPMVTSQLNIRPVFDVHADVQGRDLYGAAGDIDKVLKEYRPDASKALTVTLSGQVETMRESYTGLFTGIALAIILVYLFLVMNFQSWIDPLIVLMAVPFALGGVMWMLFLSQTPMSVPALMGTLMCIGLTTANSILVVTFANQRMAAGDDPLRAAISAGYTRLRPVLMTAGAMIVGMVPMALGIGEGGEQNAPLGRAVIGGLLFATFATLIFVPTMYCLLRRQADCRSPIRILKVAPMPSHDPENSDRSATERESSHGSFPTRSRARSTTTVSTGFDPEHGSAHQKGRCHCGGHLAGVFAAGGGAAFFPCARCREGRRDCLLDAAAGGHRDRPARRPRDRIWSFPGRLRHGTRRRSMRASTAMWPSGWWTSAIMSKRANCWRSSRHPNSMPNCRPQKRSSSASLAQVSARKAEAEFSKTTNERWRDSPKGVVSEQERESKKADYESAEARLYAANAQVNLDKSKVDQYSALTEFKLVQGSLRWHRHRTQDRYRQPGDGRQRIDDHASVSHGADRSLAHFRRRAAERRRRTDERRGTR